MKCDEKIRFIFFALSYRSLYNQMLDYPALVSFENWIQVKDLDICSVLTAL